MIMSNKGYDELNVLREGRGKALFATLDDHIGRQNFPALMTGWQMVADMAEEDGLTELASHASWLAKETSQFCPNGGRK